MAAARAALIWSGLVVAIATPLILAAFSPLLAWRQGVYILAGFAGIVGLALMLLQPLLAAGYIPHISAARARRVHLWIGISLVLCIIIHVGGLWITSPPDVVDALLFRSPTPFSAWGVVAMWAIFAAAIFALMRCRLRLRWRTWRIGHASLATITVLGTVVHALLIEGAMETVSKVALCGLVLGATGKVLFDLKIFHRRRRD